MIDKLIGERALLELVQDCDGEMWALLQSPLCHRRYAQPAPPRRQSAPPRPLLLLPSEPPRNSYLIFCSISIRVSQKKNKNPIFDLISS